MIALDFYSGSHGHFLEYLINTYIFRGPKVPLMTDLGTCHLAKKNTEYLANQVIKCGHYSEFNLPTNHSPEKIIRISVKSELERICYQINVFCRAGDIPSNNKILSIPIGIRNNPARLRNDFYSKFYNDGYCIPDQWRWPAVPYYEFPLENLYDLQKLYCGLKKISDFLQHSFNPDQTLAILWQDFMNKNHGWIKWNRMQQILTNVLMNKDIKIELDVIEQALLNYMLTESYNIHDGKLFENSEYPTNTGEIYSIIQQHVTNFDLRF